MNDQSQPQAAPDGRVSGHGTKTDAVREQAILALLSERSIQAAATRCGVGERTLRTWLGDDPAFQAAYRAARHAAFETGLSRIQAMTGAAVDALADLLGPQINASVRLGAARTVLEVALHQADTDTLMRRLEALEQAHRQSRSRR
jgi:hypothetical protein